MKVREKNGGLYLEARKPTGCDFSGEQSTTQTNEYETIYLLPQDTLFLKVTKWEKVHNTV
jgi:hypothetical protein